jgi:hypothetical protein
MAKPPVISTRANGDRLVGQRGPFAEQLYAAGTPPMHGLASTPRPAERVSRVRIGDRLRPSGCSTSSGSC